MIEYLLLILAIENLSDILVKVDLLQGCRDWFKKNFPKIGKLAECKYCQMFWMSLFCFCVAMPPSCLILALSAHRLATLVSEFYDRYMNQAPLNVYVQQATVSQEADSLQK